MLNSKVCFAYLTLCVLSVSFLKGQTIFVSPRGTDKNPGTKEKPVLTIGKAQKLARKMPAGSSVEVVFANGTYYLPQTACFTA